MAKYQYSSGFFFVMHDLWRLEGMIRRKRRKGGGNWEANKVTGVTDTPRQSFLKYVNITALQSQTDG